MHSMPKVLDVSGRISKSLCILTRQHAFLMPKLIVSSMLDPDARWHVYIVRRANTTREQVSRFYTAVNDIENTDNESSIHGLASRFISQN